MARVPRKLLNNSQSSAIKRGLIFRDIIYDTAIPVAKSESDIKITTDTPYLALTDEVWSVCY